MKKRWKGAVAGAFPSFYCLKNDEMQDRWYTMLIRL